MAVHDARLVNAREIKTSSRISTRLGSQASSSLEGATATAVLGQFWPDVSDRDQLAFSFKFLFFMPPSFPWSRRTAALKAGFRRSFFHHDPRSHHKGTTSMQTDPAGRVGFELATDGIQFYVFANWDKTSTVPDRPARPDTAFDPSNQACDARMAWLR